MQSKKCSNCGNDNDPLLTNCLFCKSSLPTIDINSIPNEVLVMNAGEWIGKLKEGTYVVTAKENNMWTGKGYVRINKAEIQGYSLKYLSLINVRAVSNTNLNAVYHDLKNQYDIGLASDDSIVKHQKRTIKLLMWYGIFVIIIITIFILESKF